MTGELNVDPDALAIAARGINDVIGEGDVRLRSIQLTGMEAGTPELASAYTGFLDRWSWGVRSLVEDANTIAQSLDLSAGIYHDGDSYIEGAFKVLGGSAFGDPHLTEQQLVDGGQ